MYLCDGPPVSAENLLDLFERVLIIHSFMQQASGIYGMVNFFPLLIQSLGITGDVPLILYGEHYLSFFAGMRD